MNQTFAMKYYQDLRTYYRNSHLRSALRDIVHYTQDICEHATIIAADTFDDFQKFMVSRISLERKEASVGLSNN